MEEERTKMEVMNLTPKNKVETIRSYLGTEGRLLFASKTMYREKHPNHKIFFNACLFDSNFTQLWWGDINFNLDNDSLQLLANYLKETIYITMEHDYRWNGLKKSQINNDKVVVYKPIKK